MLDEEERNLIALGEKINSIPMPDCIDECIKKGIEMGRRKKRKIRINKIFSVAAVVIITFVTLVRVSPAFAKCVSSIPGFEYIIKLINYDKGIKDAVDNNFVQHINMSEEHEGLIFTIKDIIIDDSKAIIFYSIENKGNHKFVNIAKIDFKNEKDEILKAFSNFSSFINKDISVEKKLEGSVQLSFGEETIIPDKMYISVKLKDDHHDNIANDKDKTLTSVWNFKIPIDKKRYKNMKKIYTLNQSIEIEGQRILFKDVTITPTRTAVKIEYDKNNSKQILGFDDISIVDENGETRSSIKNGVIAATTDSYNQILYFQSNFFNNPKEIYITGNSIRALDKNKTTVIVDTENKKLIKAPDERLKLVSINSGDKELSLQFDLKVDKNLEGNNLYNIFNYEFKDANGNSYNSSSIGSTLEGNHGDINAQSVYYKINNNSKFKSPIYLTIYNYPTRINGDFKVKIK